MREEQEVANLKQKYLDKYIGEIEEEIEDLRAERAGGYLEEVALIEKEKEKDLYKIETYVRNAKRGLDKLREYEVMEIEEEAESQKKFLKSSLISDLEQMKSRLRQKVLGLSSSGDLLVELKRLNPKKGKAFQSDLLSSGNKRSQPRKRLYRMPPNIPSHLTVANISNDLQLMKQTQGVDKELVASLLDEVMVDLE